MYNPNSGYGLAESIRLHLNLPVMGKLLVVAPVTDPNYDRLSNIVRVDPDGVVRLYTTVAAAYAAATTDANDVIAISAYASHSAAMLTVSKNRIHFIGMDSGGRKNSQGAKLMTPATSVSASVAVIKNTGTRNTFRNIKFIQNGTDNAQTSGVIDEGEGTYMENCEMEVNSILTIVTQGLLFAGDTCHYKNCQIGSSTVYHTAGSGNVMLIAISNNKYPRYSYFENCTLISRSSQTTAACIRASMVIGWIKFENCSLMNARLSDGVTAGGAMAAGVVMASTAGYLMFDSRCTSYGAGLFAASNAYILNAAVASGKQSQDTNAATGTSDELGGVATAQNDS